MLLIQNQHHNKTTNNYKQNIKIMQIIIIYTYISVDGPSILAKPF